MEEDEYNRMLFELFRDYLDTNYEGDRDIAKAQKAIVRSYTVLEVFLEHTHKYRSKFVKTKEGEVGLYYSLL